MKVIKESILVSLKNLGIKDIKEISYNPPYDELYTEELDPNLEGFEKGYLTELGAVNVKTGIFTGRSPKDKFIVEDTITKDSIWWTSEKAKNDNKPTTQAVWNELKGLVATQLSNKKLYVGKLILLKICLFVQLTKN